MVESSLTRSLLEVTIPAIDQKMAWLYNHSTLGTGVLGSELLSRIGYGVVLPIGLITLTIDVARTASYGILSIACALARSDKFYDQFYVTRIQTEMDTRLFGALTLSVLSPRPISYDDAFENHFLSLVSSIRKAVLIEHNLFFWNEPYYGFPFFFTIPYNPKPIDIIHESLVFCPEKRAPYFLSSVELASRNKYPEHVDRPLHIHPNNLSRLKIVMGFTLETERRIIEFITGIFYGAILIGTLNFYSSKKTCKVTSVFSSPLSLLFGYMARTCQFIKPEYSEKGEQEIMPHIANSF